MSLFERLGYIVPVENGATRALVTVEEALAKGFTQAEIDNAVNTKFPLHWAVLTEDDDYVNEDHYETMLPIPISAARHIAKEYGYDQVVILARRVGEDPAPNGEHITTYGINETHCDVAARMGDKLKKICGWPDE